MAWVRIDDQAPRHRKMLAAGPAACWLWVCGNAHCQSQLTDGFISDAVLPMIGVPKGYQALAAQLVAVGLWDRVDGGYAVHDYLDVNKSRAEVLARRAEDSERKRLAESARIPRGNGADSGRPIPSHPYPSDLESSARVLDAYRERWKTAYGYECSLLPKPLQLMQIGQQIAAHSEARLVAALDAYFATPDQYVRSARHPLALWLRDPVRFLAKDAISTGRPKGCRHDPPCTDDAAHTSRDLADRRRIG